MKYNFYLLLLIQFAISAAAQDYQKEYDSLNANFWSYFNTDSEKLPAILDQQETVALKSGDLIMIGENLSNRAGYWSRIPNSGDSLIYYCALSFDIFAQIPDYARMANAKRVIGSYQQLYGRYDESRQSLLASLKFGIASGEKKHAVKALSALGSLESRLGDDLKALSYYQKSLEVIETIDDSLTQISISPKGSMALLYSHKGDYEQAIPMMQEFIDEKISVGNYWLAAQWTNNIAVTYLQAGDTILAKKKCFEAMDYGSNAEFKYGVASACINLAEIHLTQNQLDSAALYINRIHTEIPTIDEVDFSAVVAKVEGQYHYQNQNYKTAIKLYDKSFLVWEETKSYFKLAPLAKLYADAYEAKGDYKEALVYQKMYKSYSDSLMNQENIEEFKELEMTYAFNKKLMSDSLANIQNLQAVELGYQKDIVAEQRSKNLLIFGLILICLVVFFVYMAYRRNEKQKGLLNEKNLKIAEALEQNQLLLKELHHRVKNNFQIISSLLEMQAKGIEDEKALELAFEGQNRIRSMSLIHQRLYQEGDLSIDFSAYLESLVRDIAQAYDKGKVLQLEIQSGDYVFDVDTAIPVGLIINELVTNAFKYGFSQSERILKVILSKEKGSDYYHLEVVDNGDGIPEGIDLKKVKSLGLRLVNGLSKQLHGNFEFVRNPNSKFIVRFKDTETRLLVT